MGMSDKYMLWALKSAKLSILGEPMKNRLSVVGSGIIWPAIQQNSTIVVGLFMQYYVSAFMQYNTVSNVIRKLLTQAVWQ